MEEYLAEGIEEVTVGNVPCMQVSYKKPDGTMMHHVFPVGLINNKVEQMDLDPTNDDHVDKAMDWILHEPFIMPDDAPQPQAMRAFAGTQTVHESPERVTDLEVRAAKGRVALRHDSVPGLRDRMRAAAAVELRGRKESVE